ncbi:MAG: tRNA (adenosine(37)-N6)-dimethylallyltransferase MiaA [Deltaproteobacteria bacterium]|nr:tRNA (adenosine(37)-N6)-dimethylallyltransferase MiaA [Deltaproteobacteria bacterium]
MGTAKQKLIVVQGPTGVGKTALALALARAVSGEIINADSMQFYRHMDIGTSKPTVQEQSDIPHHLFSVVNPDEQYNAARFMLEARRTIADIAGRGKVPLIVGGTGLYVRALTRGLSSAPPADESLRQKLRRLGKDELYARLLQVDPDAAACIGPNDMVRLVRALEVYQLTGSTLTHYNRIHGFQDEPYECLKLCLTRNRKELYILIGQRVERMMQLGLIREVETLYSLGYGPELRPLRSIGYKQIGLYLSGTIPLSEAVSLIHRETRRFAKRQLTWLRHDSDTIWIELPGQAAQVDAHAKKFLNLD